MSEKAGRNDPCPCGSGKKYKQCCLLKKQKEATPQGKRKFTAKIISSGATKPIESAQATSESQHQQAVVDYNTLMERAFGSALTSDEAMPPLPENPSEYLQETEDKSPKSK